MKLSFIKKLSHLIIILYLCLVVKHVYAGLPDLSIDTNDISFSNNLPEPTEVITISATIHNIGDLYFDNSPVSKYEVIYDSAYYVDSVLWLAQSFYTPTNIYLSKVEIMIRNYPETSMDDYITVEIRNNGANQLPQPSPCTILASKSLNSSNTNFYWQDFVFDNPPYLTADTTYWLCVECTSPQFDGYGWRYDSGTSQDRLVASLNLGTSWTHITGISNGVYRAYKVENPTVVSFYNGDPDTTGVLISSQTIPVPRDNGNIVVSTTWTAITSGSYDIYVLVDSFPAVVTELNETNNKNFRQINFTPVLPSITSVSPSISQGVNVTEQISITFSEDMDVASSTNSISVNAIKTNDGLSVNIPVIGTISYANRILTFTFNLNKGYTYSVTVSTDAKDLYGNSIPEAKIWSFSTVMDYTLSNTFISGDTKVLLGAESISEDYYVIIDSNPLNDPSILNSITKADNKMNRLKGVFSRPIENSFRNCKIYKASYQGTEFKGSFQNSVQVTIPYVETGDSKVLLSNGKVVKENTLKLYYLDQEKNLWVKVPTSEVDTLNNEVSATVNHFSIFAVLGTDDTDISDAYAYPVPWKPFDGQDETGTLAGGITFTGLGSRATIRIYTISGELVKVLEYEYNSSGEQLNWDVTNTEGNLLASGLYIYYIENDKQHKTGKLIVIK